MTKAKHPTPRVRQTRRAGAGANAARQRKEDANDERLGLEALANDNGKRFAMEDVHRAMKAAERAGAKNPAAVALGRLGRAANTRAQQEASRVNGANGGRPKGSKDSTPRTRRAA